MRKQEVKVVVNDQGWERDGGGEAAEVVLVPKVALNCDIATSQFLIWEEVRANSLSAA